MPKKTRKVIRFMDPEFVVKEYRTLRVAGYSEKEIAEAFGFMFPEYDSIHIDLFREWLSLQHRIVRIRKAEIIAKLHEDGMSFADIAKNLEIGESSARSSYEFWKTGYSFAGLDSEVGNEETF